MRGRWTPLLWNDSHSGFGSVVLRRSFAMPPVAGFSFFLPESCEPFSFSLRRTGLVGLALVLVSAEPRQQANDASSGGKGSK